MYNESNLNSKLFNEIPVKPKAPVNMATSNGHDKRLLNELSNHKREGIIDAWVLDVDDNSNSISSEKYGYSASCAKYYNQKLWSSEEVARSLKNLPAGEAALAVLPTFKKEQLSKIVEKISENKISESASNFSTKPSLSKIGHTTSKVVENQKDPSLELIQLIKEKPNTCLFVACWLASEDLVEVLVKVGALVTYRDSTGRTPLHLAASIGNVKIIELLLAEGADPNARDFEKQCTALHCAAVSKSVASVQRLIDAGADVNAGLSGASPLLYAVQVNGESCVELLLKAGASPNNPQVYTETPLHVAASLGLADCVKLLLDYGADVRVQMGDNRCTPLHLAAEQGSSLCTKLLLNAGASVDAKNVKGQTALHIAALSQSPETLDSLISAGAKIDAQDDNGRTALHAAAIVSTRESELVRALIEAGASVDKADKFGYTPLHLAALNENSSTVMLLISKGADVTKRTKGGRIALNFITRKTPDVLPWLVTRFDNAISVQDHELGDVNCELRLNFLPLVSGGKSESELMLCLVKAGHGHMLKHPLCESFLYLKWLKIRKFYFFSLIFYTMYVTIFTAYILVTYLWNFSQCSDALFWLIIVFNFVLTVKEIFQIAHGVSTYIKGRENVLQWCVITTSCLALVRSSENWQQHLAAIAVLLAWVELMMIVGRFPTFGLYIQMFTQVAVNFFKFLGAYLGLIVGFSLGFCILHKNYKSFTNPLISLLKTVIMLSGELEFEDVFFDKEAPVLYSGTAHLMLLVFVVLVTVILTNLMMGLAVSDIQELRQSAGLDRLVKRAELIAHMESLLFSKFLNYAPKKLIRKCRRSAMLVQLPYHCAINIRPNDPRERRLSKELKTSIFQLISDRKIKKKQSFHNSTAAHNGINTHRLTRAFSTSSRYENQNHLMVELAMEMEKISSTINSKLESFQLKIETISKNMNSFS